MAGDCEAVRVMASSVDAAEAGGLVWRSCTALPGDEIDKLHDVLRALGIEPKQGGRGTPPDCALHQWWRYENGAYERVEDIGLRSGKSYAELRSAWREWRPGLSGDIYRRRPPDQSRVGAQSRPKRRVAGEAAVKALREAQHGRATPHEAAFAVLRFVEVAGIEDPRWADCLEHTRCELQSNGARRWERIQQLEVEELAVERSLERPEDHPRVWEGLTKLWAERHRLWAEQIQDAVAHFAPIHAAEQEQDPKGNANRCWNPVPLRVLEAVTGITEGTARTGF